MQERYDLVKHSRTSHLILLAISVFCLVLVFGETDNLDRVVLQAEILSTTNINSNSVYQRALNSVRATSQDLITERQLFFSLEDKLYKLRWKTGLSGLAYDNAGNRFDCYRFRNTSISEARPPGHQFEESLEYIQAIWDEMFIRDFHLLRPSAYPATILLETTDSPSGGDFSATEIVKLWPDSDAVPPDYRSRTPIIIDLNGHVSDISAADGGVNVRPAKPSFGNTTCPMQLLSFRSRPSESQIRRPRMAMHFWYSVSIDPSQEIPISGGYLHSISFGTIALKQRVPLYEEAAATIRENSLFENTSFDSTGVWLPPRPVEFSQAFPNLAEIDQDFRGMTPSEILFATRNLRDMTNFTGNYSVIGLTFPRGLAVYMLSMLMPAISLFGLLHYRKLVAIVKPDSFPWIGLYSDLSSRTIFAISSVIPSASLLVLGFSSYEERFVLAISGAFFLLVSGCVTFRLNQSLMQSIR